MQVRRRWSWAIHVQIAENENNQVIKFWSRQPSSVIIPVNSPEANKLPDSRYEDAKAWTKRTISSLIQYVPGRLMHPYAKTVREWNKFVVLLCLFILLLDFMSVFPVYVNQDRKCTEVNQTITIILIVLQSLTSFIYLLYMLHNFRLANLMS